MPMNRSLYPANWKEIRARIMERAQNKCEWCGMPHYAVFCTDKEGNRTRACGTLYHDEAGNGELPYREAREMASHLNDAERESGRWGVCVLTTAHLDHDTTNNSDDNLRALCNRCHLRHDAKHHAANAKKTRDKKKGQNTLEIFN